jgi:hypothetical protein
MITTAHGRILDGGRHPRARAGAHRPRTGIGCAALMLAAFGFPEAAAADPPLERVMLRAGVMRVSGVDTLLRLDARGFPLGTNLDFDEALGGETSADAARLEALYRFDPHHALSLSWYAFRLAGERVIDEQIQWGDLSYAVNTKIASFLESETFKLAYRYSFHRDERIELGALLGVNVVRMSVGLEASGTALSETESGTALLPAVGFYTRYRFEKRLALETRFELSALNHHGTRKSALDILVGLEYRLTPRLGLGGALNVVSLDAEWASGSTLLTLHHRWRGWLGYVALYL